MMSSEIQQEFEGVKCVIIKDMASYVYPDFEMFLDEGFNGFRHTFLIRHPRKSMISLHRGNLKLECSTWNSAFDPDEGIGFLRLYSMYKFVIKHLDSNPVVIDADDLQAFPEEMMFSFCQAVGIDYKQGMTQWKPGLTKDLEEHYKLFSVEYASVWAGNAHRSSGFNKHNKQSHSEDVHLPEEMEKVIERCMPCYEHMFKNRIKANV